VNGSSSSGPGYLGSLDDDIIAAITHRNAMRHFDFDPFAHITPGRRHGRGTAGEGGPRRRRALRAPSGLRRPREAADVDRHADAGTHHPLLDEQAEAEGVGA
jgi:hypothetical protein